MPEKQKRRIRQNKIVVTEPEKENNSVKIDQESGLIRLLPQTKTEKIVLFAKRIGWFLVRKASAEAVIFLPKNIEIRFKPLYVLQGAAVFILSFAILSSVFSFLTQKKIPQE